MKLYSARKNANVGYRVAEVRAILRKIESLSQEEMPRWFKDHHGVKQAQLYWDAEQQKQKRKLERKIQDILGPEYECPLE